MSLVTFEGIAFDHDKTSYTLDPGAETTLYKLENVAGKCSVYFSDDGDGVFMVRVKTDGRTEFEISTRAGGVSERNFSYMREFAITLYNPGATSATASSETFNVRCFVRRLAMV